MAQTPALVLAHKHSSHHRNDILQSRVCGCFYCYEIFPPDMINKWVDEVNGKGQTALCPFCEIDSLIGDKSGYPVNEEFLRKMNLHWF